MRRGLALGSAILVAAAASVLVFSPSVPHPQALPSVQSLRDYGPVPTGVQLLYGANASNLLWVTAFDWQGNPRGTLKLPAPLGHELVPQAHCFVLEDQQTFDEILYTEVPGQSRMRVGGFANEGSLGQTGVEAVECNFRRNFGIAVRIVHPDGSTSEIPGKYAWILPPYADGYYPYKGGPD